MLIVINLYWLFLLFKVSSLKMKNSQELILLPLVKLLSLKMDELFKPVLPIIWVRISLKCLKFNSKIKIKKMLLFGKLVGVLLPEVLVSY